MNLGKLPTLDQFFENLYNCISPMFTQFDKESLISKEVQEMLGNKEGRNIIQEILKTTKTGELNYIYKGQQIKFYK